MEPVRAWIDAQLPPSLAVWLRDECQASAVHVQDLDLLEASDSEIFAAAAASESPIVVVTKDSDFATLLNRRGAPPQVVWLRCGNVSNRELRRIIVAAWPRATALLAAGEVLVEIRSRRGDPG